MRQKCLFLEKKKKLEVLFKAHAFGQYLCLILQFECGVVSMWYRL